MLSASQNKSQNANRARAIMLIESELESEPTSSNVIILVHIKIYECTDSSKIILHAILLTKVC